MLVIVAIPVYSWQCGAAFRMAELVCSVNLIYSLGTQQSVEVIRLKGPKKKKKSHVRVTLNHYTVATRTPNMVLLLLSRLFNMSLALAVITVVILESWQTLNLF